MALITVPVTAVVASTATPDKMIMVGTNSNATIYTCPTGRKFIGQGVLSSNASAAITMGTGGNGNVIGSTSGGFSFDMYLQAGKSVTCQYSGISGIESDA